MNDIPDLRRIVALVKQAGQDGCTVAYLARVTGGTEQAITKALALQIVAGIMRSNEAYEGERFLYTVYRMREGLPG